MPRPAAPGSAGFRGKPHSRSIDMSDRVIPASEPRIHTGMLLVAAAWIVGFLWLFFNQPLQDPDGWRTDVWGIIADEVLGLDRSETSDATARPASGIEFLSQRLSLFAIAVLLLILAAVQGDAICVLLLRRSRLLWCERISICFGLGLAVLSLETLCCGLAGQLNRAAMIGPPVIACVVSSAVRWCSRNGVHINSGTVPKQEQRSSTILSMLVLIIVVPFAAYLLLGSVSPPTDFDVREYHLQGPKEWFQQGHISFLRHNVYTSFPFLSEMLCLTGMVFAGDWWRGALVGQIVLASFQLLSALSIYAVARRRIGCASAWLAVLIYLTTPWTLRVSLIAYAEGSLTFYLISSTMVALMTVDCDRSNRKSLILVAGLLAGSAMASKYTGLVCVILPTAAVIGWTIWRTRLRNKSETVPESPSSAGTVKQLTYAAAWFSLGVALMIMPWLLRNLADTGNPVYPLGYSVFGGSEWSSEMNARWKPAHAPAEHRIDQIPQHFLDAAVRNKWTSALLFALAIPSVLLWRRIPAVAIVLCLTAWGFVMWWALTHRIDRFWIPMIPLLSVAAGSTWLLSSSRIWRGFLSIVIAGVTLFNLRFCAIPPLIGFHAGLMDLNAARQLVIRSDIRLLNATLPPSSKVLMVGEAEVFDATFPLAYNTVFDDCLFEEWTTQTVDASRSAKPRRMRAPESVKSALQANGITHMVVNWGEILRYRLPGSYGFTDYVQPAQFEELVRRGVLKRPTVLLVRPWSGMSPGERNVVEDWDGHEQLIAGGESFSVVEFYEVVQE